MGANRWDANLLWLEIISGLVGSEEFAVSVEADNDLIFRHTGCDWHDGQVAIVPFLNRPLSIPAP